MIYIKERHIFQRKTGVMPDQLNLVVHHVASDPISLSSVRLSSLFVFCISFTTILLFSLKIKVLRRPVEVTAVKRPLDNSAVNNSVKGR